jgi:hypothetical protein
MHRSSENVAAIATTLAKAQTELSNPEKAMIGTVYDSRSDGPQSFRYASQSSGLDIIRKAWGGHQIAVAQTTHIASPPPGGTHPREACLPPSIPSWIAVALFRRLLPISPDGFQTMPKKFARIGVM